jgi:hypothetical protein
VSEVIDLNQRRLAKAVDSGRISPLPGVTLEGTPALDASDWVPILGCSGCQSTDFQLAHDHRVICSRCKFVIYPLRWYDTEQPPEGAV